MNNTIGSIQKETNINTKRNKVLDSIKSNREERIDLTKDSIYNFVKKRGSDINYCIFRYKDSDGGVISCIKKLFISGKVGESYLCSFDKGSTTRGPILRLESYKDLEITGIMKTNIKE